MVQFSLWTCWRWGLNIRRVHQESGGFIVSLAPDDGTNPPAQPLKNRSAPSKKGGITRPHPWLHLSVRFVLCSLCYPLTPGSVPSFLDPTAQWLQMARFHGDAVVSRATASAGDRPWLRGVRDAPSDGNGANLRRNEVTRPTPSFVRIAPTEMGSFSMTLRSRIKGM